VCSLDVSEPLPVCLSTFSIFSDVRERIVQTSAQAPPIEPPVISMLFTVNDSPLAGKEGTKLTSTHIKERLFKVAAVFNS
jgi:GTP-binding protein